MSLEQMTLGEAKDIVREHFSRTAMPSGMLDQALAEGRRIVEDHGNFWWMNDDVDFVADINVEEYPITDPVGVIALPNFKDIKAFNWRRSGDTRWIPLTDVGTFPKDELDTMYNDDIPGTPEAVIVEANSLILYPKPLEAYQCRMYAYVRTSNPLSNLETDELLSAQPMALVYAALVWGYEQQLKDFQGAGYWRALLGGTPFGKGGKLAALKHENFKRAFKDKGELVPKLGSNPRYSRLDNMKIYR